MSCHCPHDTFSSGWLKGGVSFLFLFFLTCVWCTVVIDDREPGPQLYQETHFVEHDAETQFDVYDDGHINATLIPLTPFIARAREHRHDILECIAASNRSNVRWAPTIVHCDCSVA